MNIDCTRTDPRTRSRALGALTILCIAISLGATAAEKIEEVAVYGRADNPYTEDDSTLATRLSLSLKDTPQSVTVFTRERLDDQHLVSLRDVLDQTPGVYSYSWDSERVVFTSRGFTIDNLLYDGVPAVTNFNTDSLDETIETAFYERIEIVRGATGLATGAGSPAAAVNLVRKHATSSEPDARIDISAGSWDNQRFEGDVSTPLNSSGSVRARLVGVYQDRDSYQDLYSSERRSLYGVVDADVTQTTRVSVGATYQENNADGNTWGSFPLFLANGALANWDRDVTTATDWSFWDRRTRSVFTEIAQQLPNDWLVSATITRRKFNEDSALFYMYGFPDPVTGEGLDPYADRSKGSIDETTYDMYLRGPFELFGSEHELVVGYNNSHAVYDGVGYEPGELASTGDFFDWDGSYPDPGFATTSFLVNDIDSHQDGVYAATRFQLLDALKLIAGARYSTFDTDYYSAYDAAEDGFDYDYQKLIPYAGLVYDVSDNYSIFASYTEIFKGQNAKNGNDQYLDPLEGESAEAGVKAELLDGRLYSSLTVFDTRQDNVAAPVYDPDTGEPILLPDGTEVSRAIDGTKTRGVELEVTGELRDGWNVTAGWTKYSLEDDNGDKVNSFVPRSLLRLFTTWTPSFGDGRLMVGGGFDWQSASKTFVSSPDGGTMFHQDDVTLIGLLARYQVTPKLAAQLNAENIFDETFYVLDNYDNTSYGAPRSVTGSLSYSF